MSTWIKADGREIEINDTEGSAEAALAAGWTRKQASKPKSVAKPAKKKVAKKKTAKKK